MTLDDLFAPPGTPWQRLHPNYLSLKLLMIPLTWGIFFALLGVASYLFAPSWVNSSDSDDAFLRRTLGFGPVSSRMA